MPQTELWFVYDKTQGDFKTFLNEPQAQAEYDKIIKQINNSVGRNDEYDGDEQITLGRIHKRAEVVPVEINDNGEELWSLVSYGLVNP